MSDDKKPETAAASFIPKELRPGSTAREEAPVIPPDVSRDELRRRSGEVLGPLLRNMLGVGSGPGGLTAADLCVRSDHVTFAEVDGEAVLLDLGSGHYYSLNRTGTAIWKLLVEQRSLGDVVALLCDSFEVDPDTAWEDLTALVHNLCAEKLATVEGAKDGA